MKRVNVFSICSGAGTAGARVGFGAVGSVNMFETKQNELENNAILY